MSCNVDFCPLFRQKNISIETKGTNLKLLIEAQTTGFRATATIKDLESAIIEAVE